ncbi:hypothetical protein RFI_32714 [Reticulomyxa filosa]|uniref:Uncharacterized protein n=1 Tax=Reticulomyxa filosa TaxID=46433 RepID=X6LSP9_RETFI|nr:hypothetical protein RFI_32714 [Reticulomyxa filosa]|eukprot:ETO04679.1 hypothetical protein RFI_32714 [Reticulomyxa filosa]
MRINYIRIYKKNTTKYKKNKNKKGHVLHSSQKKEAEENVSQSVTPPLSETIVEKEKDNTNEKKDIVENKTTSTQLEMDKKLSENSLATNVRSVSEHVKPLQGLSISNSLRKLQRQTESVPYESGLSRHDNQSDGVHDDRNERDKYTVTSGNKGAISIDQMDEKMHSSDESTYRSLVYLEEQKHVESVIASIFQTIKISQKIIEKWRQKAAEYDALMELTHQMLAQKNQLLIELNLSQELSRALKKQFNDLQHEKRTLLASPNERTRTLRRAYGRREHEQEIDPDIAFVGTGHEVAKKGINLSQHFHFQNAFPSADTQPYLSISVLQIALVVLIAIITFRFGQV